MDQVARIQELLDEVQDKLNWLVDKINGLLSSVPYVLQWAADKFLELWNWAMDKVKEFWAKVTEFVSYLGQPWALNDAKESWIQLGSPVAARAFESDKSQSGVDGAWKGKAADRYGNALPAQKSALTSVQSKLANPMGPALGSLASALYVFFGVVIGAIVALIVAHAVASEAVSIICLPAVPPTLITAYGACIVLLIGAMTNLNNAVINAT